MRLPGCRGYPSDPGPELLCTLSLSGRRIRPINRCYYWLNDRHFLKRRTKRRLTPFAVGAPIWLSDGEAEVPAARGWQINDGTRVWVHVKHEGTEWRALSYQPGLHDGPGFIRPKR